MKPLTIAVTGLNRGELVQAGSAVANSIRREYPETKIVGLSYDPFESSLYSSGMDRIDNAFLMPYPHKGPKVLLERLDQILKVQPIDMIIPNLDTEIPNYLDLHAELKQRKIKLPLVTKNKFDRRDKQNLARLCKLAKIPVPRTEIAETLDDLRDICEEIGFPVYIKGKMFGGAQANSPQEAGQVYRSLIAAWGSPLIVQAALKSEDEFGVIGFGDGKGDVMGYCAIRKIVITATGKAYGGIVIANKAIEEYTRRVIKTLKWWGPFDLEFIKSENDYYVIEMNPRFPAWVDFPSQMNCNLPATMVSWLFNDLKPPKIKHCPAGKLFMRHCYDVIGDISQIAAITSDRR